ncbi:hypothetical protein ACRAQ6_06240 [Erythrobacter sp. HA6-11]
MLFYRRSEKAGSIVVEAIKVLGRNPPALSHPEFLKSWYIPFTRQLMSGVTADDIGADFRNVSFVIFNYDRCVEQTLWLALQEHFSITAAQAAQALGEVQFLHPYGRLGPLPWQGEGQNKSLEFAFDPLVANFPNIASRSRTFTESTESGEIEQIHRAITDSERLIFLGFGFLKQNVELLSPPVRIVSRAIATGYELSDANILEVSQLLRRFVYGGQEEFVTVVNGGCRQLFDDHALEFAHR